METLIKRAKHKMSHNTNDISDDGSYKTSCDLFFSDNDNFNIIKMDGYKWPIIIQFAYIFFDSTLKFKQKNHLKIFVNPRSCTLKHQSANIEGCYGWPAGRHGHM